MVVRSVVVVLFVVVVLLVVVRDVAVGLVSRVAVDSQKSQDFLHDLCM